MRMGEMSDAKKAIETARRLLAGIAKEHPDQRGVVAEITKLIGSIEVELVPHRPLQRRTGENTRYAVEIINHRQMLSEYRSVGRPLRVDKPLFDGIVSMLAGTSKPIAFEEIADGVERLIGTRPVEWQMRVVLRFLLRADPPILKRNRSRYSPESKAIRASAAKWWQSTVQQPSGPSET
jgi:hypothetical protein